MNNTEIFELCETSSEQNAPIANNTGISALFLAFVEHVLNRRKEQKEVDKNNYDVVSILGYVVKKNNGRGGKHGPFERQRRYCKAKEMLQRTRQPKPKKVHPYLRDGKTTTNTESLCHSSDGQSRKESNMTRLPWRIIHTSQQELREFKIQNIGSSN